MHADPVPERVSRRTRLAAVVDQVRPVMLAREHTLPVAAPLVQLFPDGALRRGITITIDGGGAASVALALAAAPVQSGSWVALVDLPCVNLVAVAEAGIALERVACIDSRAQWAATIAALLGAFDLVIAGRASRVRAGDVRRLTARARERGSVLVALGGVSGRSVWPDAPDLALVVASGQWSGLGVGHGHLRGRTMQLQAEGRRGFARPRVIDLHLPYLPEAAMTPPNALFLHQDTPVAPIARAG